MSLNDRFIAITEVKLITSQSTTIYSLSPSFLTFKSSLFNTDTKIEDQL